MSQQLESVVVSRLDEHNWEAHHIPSGRKLQGPSAAEATERMRVDLGMDEAGVFTEPTTSQSFEGTAKSIAEYLEGPVSEMLALHSGYARLTSYEGTVAEIRLGGGCKGCPSSTMTLLNGVLGQLQDKFGADKITEVMPAMLE